MLNLKTQAALAALCLAGAAGAATANGLANGGFETPGGDLAAGWRTAPTGNPVVLSGDAHTGAHAALLSVPGGFGASTLFQDSFAHGGLAPLTAANVGDTPVLSFWAKGDVSPTGNIMFALSYMGAGGSLWSSGNQFFQGQLDAGAWTQISFQGAAIPAGTTSVFLEINTAVGPLLDGRANAVVIDDVQFALAAAPVPEPGSFALLAAGLAAVGACARGRRRHA
ncbi:MAG: PEP-CTERM sorting domain-containing protein [Roseateles sp.]|uniref:PEP-CTERM sorting domain-containing protein n=1 Tax=Roseateles sp. TaxID=1971397 RepID=UPI0039EA250D